jgi:hypothetical protein
MTKQGLETQPSADLQPEGSQGILQEGHYTLSGTSSQCLEGRTPRTSNTLSNQYDVVLTLPYRVIVTGMGVQKYDFDIDDQLHGITADEEGLVEISISPRADFSLVFSNTDSNCTFTQFITTLSQDHRVEITPITEVIPTATPTAQTTRVAVKDGPLQEGIYIYLGYDAGCAVSQTHPDGSALSDRYDLIIPSHDHITLTGDKGQVYEFRIGLTHGFTTDGDMPIEISIFSPTEFNLSFGKDCLYTQHLKHYQDDSSAPTAVLEAQGDCAAFPVLDYANDASTYVPHGEAFEVADQWPTFQLDEGSPLDVSVSQFSFNFWVQRATYVEDDPYFIENEASKTQFTTLLLVDPHKLMFESVGGVQDPAWNFAIEERDYDWHMITVTIDRNEIEGGQFYLDGQFQGTFEPFLFEELDEITVPVMMVQRPSYGPDYLYGAVKDFHFYSCLLAQDTINQISTWGTWVTSTPQAASTPTAIPTVIPTALPTVTSTPFPMYCPASPPSRIQVGIVAGVTHAVAGEVREDLRVRATPNGDRIGAMPEGTQFRVIGGYECAGDRIWWQIETLDHSLTGWVTEGAVPDDYYIEPVRN